MRDAETGSWWQQISGEAIQGKLKGNINRRIHGRTEKHQRNPLIAHAFV